MAEAAEKWVEKRAFCTLPDLFRELEKRIRKDVRCFNDLSQKRGFGRFFAVDPTPAAPHEPDREAGSSAFSVCPGEWREKGYHQDKGYFPKTGEDDRISLKIDGNKILACRAGEQPLEISTWWNDDTLTCEFLVGKDRKVMTLAQLSQRVIGDFLFEGCR